MASKSARSSKKQIKNTMTPGKDRRTLTDKSLRGFFFLVFFFKDFSFELRG